MKRICAFAIVLFPAAMALGQETETTTVTTTTTTVDGGANLTSELWYMDDATTLDQGRVELRFTSRWVTAGNPANNGDSSDDFTFTPGIAWGAAENLELFANVPIWLGAGGDRGAFEDGNYDTYAGLTWRLSDQQDWWPASALKFTARIPTGDGSDHIDGEARLILTNEYESGIRSHVNAFAYTANGMDDQPSGGGDDSFLGVDLGGLGFNFLGVGGDEIDRRHFQWGFVFGLDGPLCGDGAVRWVLDYMHRSSEYYGRNNTQILEAGWEWDIDECNRLGMSVQIGLDRLGDTPNFGAGVNYTRALTY